MEDGKDDADPFEMREGVHLYTATDRTLENSLLHEFDPKDCADSEGYVDDGFGMEEPHSPIYYESSEQSRATSSWGEEEKSAPKEESEDEDSEEESQSSEEHPEIESLREKIEEQASKEGILLPEPEPWPWHEHDIGNKKWTGNELLDQMQEVAEGMDDDDFPLEIDPCEYEPDYGKEPYIGTDQEILADPIAAWERWDRLAGMPGGLCSWRSVYDRYVPSYLRPDHPIFDDKADRQELEMKEREEREREEMVQKDMYGDMMVTDDEDGQEDGAERGRKAELAMFMQTVEELGLERAVEMKKQACAPTSNADFGRIAKCG